MIEPQQFYSEVNQNFRDISTKIDKYHSDNCQKIDKVAQDVNELKVQVAAHLASSNTAVEIKNENKEQKNHKIYWVIGIVGTIQTALIAAFETFRGN